MGAVGAVGVVGTSMRTMLKDMKRYNVSIGSNSLTVLNRGMKPVSRDGKTGTRTQDGNVEINHPNGTKKNQRVTEKT